MIHVNIYGCAEMYIIYIIIKYLQNDISWIFKYTYMLKQNIKRKKKSHLLIIKFYLMFLHNTRSSNFK